IWDATIKWPTLPGGSSSRHAGDADADRLHPGAAHRSVQHGGRGRPKRLPGAGAAWGRPAVKKGG
ncbi:unnamed protein product, partial [Heterosigma akashiwo]